MMRAPAAACAQEVFADAYEIQDCGSTVRVVYYATNGRRVEVAAVRVTKALYQEALRRALSKAMDTAMEASPVISIN